MSLALMTMNILATYIWAPASHGDQARSVLESMRASRCAALAWSSLLLLVDLTGFANIFDHEKGQHVVVSTPLIGLKVFLRGS